MSEKEPTQFPKEERGRPVLVQDQETGLIDALRTAGKQLESTDGLTMKHTELVGIEQSPDDIALNGTRPVESLLLQPDAQADLARELSELPLRGDIMNGFFNGKIVDAVVGDHMVDEATGRTKFKMTSTETGDSKWADILALSPEKQAMMEADKKTQSAKVGAGALESLDVQKPNQAQLETATVGKAADIAPQSTVAPERPVNPRQEEYDALKKEMADITNALPELDKFYLEQYCKAGSDRYDEQAGYVLKMSKELLNNTDLIKRYQALYDKKQLLMQ